MFGVAKYKRRGSVEGNTARGTISNSISCISIGSVAPMQCDCIEALFFFLHKGKKCGARRVEGVSKDAKQATLLVTKLKAALASKMLASRMSF